MREYVEWLESGIAHIFFCRGGTAEVIENEKQNYE